MSKHEERLQKVIAQSGLTSRRKAEQLILDGKVKVNNKTVTEMGVKVTSDDKVEVDGVPLEKEESVYYLLYKPRGVISSVKDDKGRKVVTDFLPEVSERVFPVGRLDYDTSGILLLTNDGEFANQLMHPSKEVNKVYVAKVKGIPHKKELLKLRKGVISDNEKLKAVYVNMLSSDKEKKTSIIELTLHEGKNRQVRRMLEAIGFPVMKLKREQYSFLTLQGLNAGEYRSLTPKEVNQLRNTSTKL
ncbi:pseudouridine synthase [Oceanobacillus neutriphilus]|uniref:Pseudouridine synthase n=1 Tax=Oceanobacillus neutriphilus TaxID=531815 RepID=A0ABQ2NTV7_9BACI|nr:pseudouridine synthase [Oceanobacillus neutriphilus]GGP10407.1 ribosomal large subunit pseudouridine synthase B [Oceanobacillus neutriphilus]